ncbi:MAG: hypothetical protein HZB83_04130 [Deltaproteobacteria bacterium]|nr:hypothetical protein [Deltaproteobacteria bacterium]
MTLAGCSNAVKYTLSGQYARARPHSVAVMPVKGADSMADGKREVSYLFRTMAVERLKAMNYNAVPLEEVDVRILKSGRDQFAGKTPKEIAGELDVDSILYIHITEWDSRLFVTYASMKFKARFELYGRDGARLWQADHSWGDADLRLDRASLELAVIKAYEPQVQRFIDLVFATLPKGETRQEEKRYFDWLP